MIYWLNRKTERALAAYLGTVVPGEMRVYRSTDMTPRQFPCAVVRAHTVRRLKGQAHAGNRIEASVIVMNEYANTVDGQAAVVERFDEIEERSVSACMEALFLGDGELATALNATGTDGVTFHYAAIGNDDDRPVVAQTTEDGNHSHVEIPLVIMAGAVEE